MRIAFVSPALNEEALLRRTVEGTIHLMDRLVIVNDGSTDRTGIIADELAREYPGKIHVIHQENRGIGGAVKHGMRWLLEHDDVDAMGVLASDNQFEPQLIARFRAILEELPEVDVAKGSRFMHPQSLDQMPRFRYWGNRGVSFVLQMALGYWGMSDVLHGYFLARTRLIRDMDLDAVADGYDLENTMMAEFRRLRATFAIVPSPSRYGEEVSKIVYKKQIPRTIKTVTGLVARRMLAGPDRLGIVLMALSVPTLGATLPLAIVRMHQTSPKVKKLRQ
ncbi:Glycosyltransferase [Labilithrix luteola]|uniref:Glycosyltransferase n=1 Tax=Labilithrix luteola TaxID=1391654 RepID=A0A0K1PS20_9BACT|nr:glycosyltransferase family 2 protein [Labilithrix luteola]AKU96312.1 Glycosyltransferase [Labilithrix luteola]